MTPRARRRTYAERREAERRARDRHMMENRQLWPLWPRLPLKRHVKGDTRPQLGILYATDPLRLAVDAMIDAHQMPRGEKTTVDKLIADGWTVD